ncbi:nucleoporin Nup186/Nup192/Nup205 [Rhizopus microsporus]|uniref:Uncharacterized protein n=1 Tax=Rhizopus microsporus TaxID=58291 RepID=A0A1X0RUG8_RHIZD|nr:hypothetical protein BCV71DRAFT_292740 [Rhizopus microsporus]
MLQMYDIPTWTEENRTLLDTLSQAKVSPEISNSLQQQLYMNKHKFLELLDNQPKNSSHRADLNANKAYINRVSHTVSKDFVTKALFLSDQLDINEHVAATLLMNGITQSSNFNCDPIDTAVLLFHAERGYLLASLEAILKFANDTSVSEQVRSVCYSFATEIMSESVPLGNNKTSTFTTKLLSTLESLTKAITALYSTGTVGGQMPAAGSGKLGEDIAFIRIERLGDERVSIVQILYHLASIFSLDAQSKLTMLEMLEKAQLTDPATSYMITTMLATISYSNQTEGDEPDQNVLSFAKSFHRRIMTHGSDVPAIKAVIVLQWVLYLTNPRRSGAFTNGPNAITTETETQQLIEAAIDANVFKFLQQYMLYFQQSGGFDNDAFDDLTNAEKASQTHGRIDYRQYKIEIRSEFQTYVIHELKTLANTIIRQLFGVLQSLKYKEEDSASVNTMAYSSEAMQTNETTNHVQIRDLEYFLTFLASVYTGPIEGGLIFWKRDDGLNHFVRWLVDIKVQSTVCAAFDFFGSISTGATCAAGTLSLFRGKADTDLGSGSLFTWKKPLMALEYYANLLSNTTDDLPRTIPVEEEMILLKFLNILKQTVQYSEEARYAFWYNNEAYCRSNLEAIIKRPTSAYLRAAVFDVISAFCSPWGGGVNGIGRDISLQWWRELVDSDLLLPANNPVSGETEKATSVNQPATLLQEIQTELERHRYTETLSLVHLIGSSIHSLSDRQKLLSGFSNMDFYIPLGQHTNGETAGATPYISLVLDTVLTGLGNDKEEHTRMKWKVTEACLVVIENSVNSFSDIACKPGLQEGLEDKSHPNEIERVLLSYLTHPGFQVLIRILSGGKITNELFDIVQNCSKEDKKKTSSTSYRRNCLLKSLRILHDVLKLQPIVCNVLIPHISKTAKKKASSEFQLGHLSFPPIPSVSNLGQLILFRNDILAQIALFINYEDDEEICLASTKLLHQLSVDLREPRQTSAPTDKLTSLTLYNPMTKAGANITSILSASKLAEDIIFCISERLGINVPEKMTCDDYEMDINLIPFWKAEGILSNIYDYPGVVETPALSSVQLAILDLLLENAHPDISSPTLTEYLLGYDLSNPRMPVIQETQNNRASLICFHTILKMLQQGVDSGLTTHDSMMIDSVEPMPLLIDTHPLLAEKCYKLIYRLCAKKSISSSTMRYLRNTTNFFYKQFEAMSSRLETDLHVESCPFSGTIRCADGTEIRSDFFRVRAKLHQRAWLLQLIALELHATTHMKQKANINRLLELLYGRSPDTDMSIHEQQETPLFSQGSFHTLQQPLVKMLEFVSSLEFVWQDDLVKDGPIQEINYFRQFVPEDFYMTNEDGIKLYDIRSIYGYLRLVQIAEYANSPDTELIEKEMGDILAACMSLNRSKEITHARRHCMKAWKQVIHISLLECFDLLNTQEREKTIYELLAMVLSKILNAHNYDSDMVKSMSEVALALINRLRKEKDSRTIAQLPIDKLRHTFNGIIECICQQNIKMTVRGDLYTALTNLLLYINRYKRDESYIEFEKYMVNVVISYKASLLDTLCRDAIDGLDIWKTTAFIAIDALNTMTLRAGSDVVQSYLLNKNFLQYTIDMLKYDDSALVHILESIDASQLPLYIFEARMSILLRLAMNPDGAELLFDNQIFEVLCQSLFMRVEQQNPASVQANISTSGELLDRYQRVMLPTLKLIVAILSTFGKKNAKVISKVQMWLKKQDTAINNILKTEGQQNVSQEAVKLIRIIQNYTK